MINLLRCYSDVVGTIVLYTLSWTELLRRAINGWIIIFESFTESNILLGLTVRGRRTETLSTGSQTIQISVRSRFSRRFFDTVRGSGHRVTVCENHGGVTNEWIAVQYVVIITESENVEKTEERKKNKRKSQTGKLHYHATNVQWQTAQYAASARHNSTQQQAPSTALLRHGNNDRRRPSPRHFGRRRHSLLRK